MAAGFSTPSSKNAGIAALEQGMALAEGHMKRGQFGEAEQVLRGLIHEFPRSPNPLNALALCCSSQSKLAEAERLMGQAILLAAREPVLFNNLGNIRRKRNDLVGAERAYRTAISLKADFAQAYYNLAVVLQDLRRPDEAENALKQACLYAPRYADALALLGAILGERGDGAQAMAALDAAVSADPQHFRALYYRGVVLTSLRRTDEALEMLQRAAAIKPDAYEVHAAFGRAYEFANRDADALAAYDRALRLAPANTKLHYSYNSLAWMMGRDDLNLRSYEEARAVIGESPDLLLAEAEQRIRAKDLEKAESLLRRAHTVAPDRADVTAALGKSLHMQKRFEDSIKILEAAVRDSPNLPGPRGELGIALLRGGEPAGAARIFEQLLATAPGDQFAAAYLSLAYREIGDSRFESMVDVDKLVRVVDLETPAGFPDIESFNRFLTQELMRLHTRKTEPFDQSMRGGTQTMGHLFVNNQTPAIDLLRAELSTAVSQYIADLSQDGFAPFVARRNPEFHYSGAWSARLRSAGYHANHIHQEGWLSSAYYVALPDAVEDEKGQQGWFKIGESPLGLGERDRPVRLVKPKVGRLVLFPSYFWHGTVPFKSDEMRLTVAFDVAPGKPLTRLMA